MATKDAKFPARTSHLQMQHRRNKGDWQAMGSSPRATALRNRELFPKAAVERVLGMDLAPYFPIPEHIPVTEHFSLDNKGLWYRFRRWAARKLDLKMPQPKQPLYSKSRNRDVARFIALNPDLRGTDLFELINLIAKRARDLKLD